MYILVKELCLCLWELWHSVIHTVINTSVLSAYTAYMLHIFPAKKTHK